jgi:hypothetical protein
LTDTTNITIIMVHGETTALGTKVARVGIIRGLIQEMTRPAIGTGMDTAGVAISVCPPNRIRLWRV